MSGMQSVHSITPNLYCCPYSAQGMHRLEVDGTGMVTAKPDTAQAVIGVITENMQLTVAQQENAFKTGAVIRAITQQGIPPENIQTQTYLIEPMYDFVEGRQVFRGYRVTHNLRVTIKNVDMIGKVVDAAVNAGANAVNGITFTVADPSVYYMAALNQAIDDAISKAAAIGNKLRVQISRVPVEIIEETYKQTPIQPYVMQASVPATPIQPGQIEITARIRTIFVYTN